MPSLAVAGVADVKSTLKFSIVSWRLGGLEPLSNYLLGFFCVSSVQLRNRNPFARLTRKKEKFLLRRFGFCPLCILILDPPLHRSAKSTRRLFLGSASADQNDTHMLMSMSIPNCSYRSSPMSFTANSP